MKELQSIYKVTHITCPIVCCLQLYKQVLFDTLYCNCLTLIAVFSYTMYPSISQTYINIRVRDDAGEGVCGNLCYISPTCGGFYMDNTLCNLVEK